MSDKTEDRPELGTTEAAVRSCVSLMAAVFGQREELLEYWLDLYFQVRSAYERENAPEPDPWVITRADLYPVMRELMQDALKSAVRSETGDRLKKREKPTTEEDKEPETEARPRAWAAKKAAIRDRLVSARAEGMTIPQLVEASGGKLEDEDIFGILNATKADMDTYRRLEAALEALGR